MSSCFLHSLSLVLLLIFFSLLHPHNRQVGQKLGLATLLMVTLPFIAFYAALELFKDYAEPVNWAGGVAILVTNLVIAGYSYSALTEEDIIVGPHGEIVKAQLDTDGDVDGKDADGPRVGFYKQRTD
jgi:phosphosulfolactate synthase (CoM biosynthesis protein A)